MLTGSLPFYAETIPETYEKILNYEVGLLMQQASPNGNQLICSCRLP